MKKMMKKESKRAFSRHRAGDPALRHLPHGLAAAHTDHGAGAQPRLRAWQPIGYRSLRVESRREIRRQVRKIELGPRP